MSVFMKYTRRMNIYCFLFNIVKVILFIGQVLFRLKEMSAQTVSKPCLFLTAVVQMEREWYLLSGIFLLLINFVHLNDLIVVKVHDKSEIS